MCAKQKKELTIRSFGTNEDLGSCLGFSEGFARAFPNEDPSSQYVKSCVWYNSAETKVILAEYKNEIVGGLLLFVPSHTAQLLPFMSAARHLNFEGLKFSCAEIFALWNASVTAGWGLGYFLLKTGLALTTKKGVEKTFYFAPDHNVRLAYKLGFRPFHQIRGNVSYPNNNMVHLFEYAAHSFAISQNEHEAMKELAEAGHLVKNEQILGNHFEIHYNLG